MKRRFLERGEKRFWKSVARRHKHDYDNHQRWFWIALATEPELKDVRARLAVGKFRAAGTTVTIARGVGV
jgi:hypothetical protein